MSDYETAMRNALRSVWTYERKGDGEEKETIMVGGCNFHFMQVLFY